MNTTKRAPKCYAHKCILRQGHEPMPHRSKNGYQWSSQDPTKRRGTRARARDTQ